MGLDDLDVVAGGQCLGGHLQQLERDVHSHAHVGSHDDGDVFGDGSDLGFLRVAKAGGANDGMHAEFAAKLQMRQGAFGTGEINQHLGAVQTLAQVGCDAHACCRSRVGRILTQCRAVRAIKCACQSQVI